jgi:hypothetical protein
MEMSHDEFVQLLAHYFDFEGTVDEDTLQDLENVLQWLPEESAAGELIDNLLQHIGVWLVADDEE